MAEHDDDETRDDEETAGEEPRRRIVQPAWQRDADAAKDAWLAGEDPEALAAQSARAPEPGEIVAPQPAPARVAPEPKAPKSTMSKNKRPIINEMPVQELRGLLDKYQEVHVRVTRTVGGGIKTTITPGCKLDPHAFVEGKFEMMLERYAGGGTFTVEVYDPFNLEELCPRWICTLPSRAFDPRTCTDGEACAFFGQATMQPQSAVQGHGGALQAGQFQQIGPIPVPAAAFSTPGIATPSFAGPNQLTPPPLDGLPPWVRNADIQSQWGIYYDFMRQQGRLPAGASIHSDQLAMRQADTWQAQHSVERAENAKLRERLDALERDARERDMKHQEDLRRMEKERAEEKHRLELERMQLQITAVAERRQTDWAPVLAALAPVAAAFVTSRTDAARIDADRTLKQHELQQTQLAQMLQRPSMMDDIVKLAPLLVPVLTQVMQNHSPAMRAELEDMRHQSQMMQLKMMSDLVMAHFDNQPEPPIWYDAIRGVLDGIVGMGKAGAFNKLLAGGNARALPPGQPQQPVQSVSGAATHLEEESETWQRLHEEDAEAAQMTKLIWDNVPRQLGFHTHEWRLLIFNMHMRLDPDELAPKLVDHLEHCEEYHMLPQPLAALQLPQGGEPLHVFDDPAVVIGTVIRGMPIGSADAEYATRLIDRVVSEIKTRQAEAGDDDDTAEEENNDDPAGRAYIDAPVPEEEAHA